MHMTDDFCELVRENAHLKTQNRELACLHTMNRLVADTDCPLPALLNEILAIIPQAFEFSRQTNARLVLDGQILTSKAFTPKPSCRLDADVFVHRVKRGRLTVSLTPDETAQATAFLPSEAGLLEGLAKHVGLIIAKREALATKRNLERQLRHADRLAKIGQFAAGMAHELNEPLANILGFAQLVAQHDGLPEQIGRDVDMIIKSALHGREVIRKLMIFSRQVPLQKKLINMNQIIRDALSFTEMRVVRNHVQVRLELAENLPDILADPQHLRQVMVNLMVNALQAMQDGGLLTIASQSFRDDVYVLVSDTGTGMTPDVLRHIFHPFFTTKDVDQGTGLGLSVAHGIVTAHGGVIEAQSQPGEGARFEITFPCSRTAPKADSEEASWATGT